MNIRQFFTFLNCIPSTKFASTRARVLFTIYDSFPRESSQCVINFWFSRECHAMVKTSLWSWNKKWVICILSRSSEHLWWQREIFNAHHPQLEALLLSYRELNLRGKNQILLRREITKKSVPSRHRSCYTSPSEDLIKISSVLQNFTNLTGS